MDEESSTCAPPNKKPAALFLLRFPKQRVAAVREYDTGERLDNHLSDARYHVRVDRRAGQRARRNDAREREEREDDAL